MVPETAPTETQSSDINNCKRKQYQEKRFPAAEVMPQLTDPAETLEQR